VNVGFNAEFPRGISAAFLLAFALLGCVHGFGPTALNYACHGGERFSVIPSGTAATLNYEGKSYVLPKRQSGIGDRYANESATLILDGDFAAFVTPELHQLDACRKV
jgi:membrane-bound inhibitor of C-type lysozyme